MQDPRCHVTLFGPLRIAQAHQLTTRFRTQKAAALLAYLAHRPGPQAREQILDIFWPDRDTDAARANLSTTLSGLRRVLEPPGVAAGGVLVSTHAHVGFNPAALTTDVAEFETLCKDAADAPPARAVELWERATALYTADFQPGNYQDWAMQEAARLQACHAQALEHLQNCYEQQSSYTQAADTARRRLALDPADEGALLALLRGLAHAGKPAAARDAAQRFEQAALQDGAPVTPALRREIAGIVGPAGTPLAALVHNAPAAPALLSSDVPAAAPSPPAAPAPRARPAIPPIAPLPFWLSRFFGREQETALLAALLLPPKASLTDPALPPRPRRLCTVVGPGGAGKTRLAAEFARTAAERFGCWCGFVALADLEDAAQIPAAIARTLRLPPLPAAADPHEQIAEFFRGLPVHRPALLVLDNMEHLLSNAAAPGTAALVVRALLDSAPRLSLLCTSRRPLGLQGEQSVPLESLAVPAVAQDGVPADGVSVSPEALARLLSVSSVALYVDRAQAARPDFGLTASNAAAVAALCRLLEGSPLALELAASWVRLLPPRRMWERIAQGEEVPGSRQSDLPPRQRSLASALEWSWRLLTEPQQRMLARLSVFRGGWSLHAAQHLCAEPGSDTETDTLALLASLQEASLIAVPAQEDAQDNECAGRCRLLETVRIFARRKLAEGDDTQPQRRHAEFFAQMAVQASPALRSPQQKHTLEALDAEQDNLRAALDFWAASPCESITGLHMAAALAPFWRARSLLREGHARLREMLRLPGAQADTAVRAAALSRSGELASLLTEYAEAEAAHTEARQIARRVADTPAEADALLGLGSVRYWQQEYAEAGEFFAASLALRQQRAAEWTEPGARDCGLAATLHSLGNLAIRRQDYTQAQQLMEQALAIRHRCDPLGVAGTVGALGQIAAQQGDLDEAARRAWQALRLFDDAGQRWTGAISLSSLSDIAGEQGDPARAACLLGAADALRTRYHFPPPPAERAGYDARIHDLRTRMGSAAFGAAWAAGQALSWEQIAQQAREFSRD